MNECHDNDLSAYDSHGYDLYDGYFYGLQSENISCKVTSKQGSIFHNMQSLWQKGVVCVGICSWCVVGDGCSML